MDIMEDRWGKLIENDPCYNPNLTRAREDFSLPVVDHALNIRLKLQRELLLDPFMNPDRFKSKDEGNIRTAGDH